MGEESGAQHEVSVGDTFSGVSHVGLGVIKCTPDAFLASCDVLALLNLVAELELPGLAAWMEDTVCCLPRPRDLSRLHRASARPWV